MTEPSAAAPAKKLHPLRFTKIQDDGHIVIYRALVKEPAEPTTTFSLTVTTASTGDEPKRTAVLMGLLNNMTAAFSFLAQPFPEEPDDTTPEPFDPQTDVLIEPGVAESTRTGLVGISVAARAATGGGSRDTVGGSYGSKHRWTAPHKKHGTVDVVSGHGWFRPPWRPHASTPISQNNSYPVNSNLIIVGSGSPMTYYVYEGFTLHLH